MAKGFLLRSTSSNGVLADLVQVGLSEVPVFGWGPHGP